MPHRGDQHHPLAPPSSCPPLFPSFPVSQQMLIDSAGSEWIGGTGRGDASEKERSPPAAVSKGSARRHTITRLPFPWDLVIMLCILIYSTCPLLFQGVGGDGSVLSVCFLCREFRSPTAKGCERSIQATVGIYVCTWKFKFFL